MSIRDKIRSEFPHACFEPQPHRALYYGPLVVLCGCGTWYVGWETPSLPISLLISIVLGNTYAMLLLLSHEVLHGACVRNRRLQTILSYFGMAPFLISPSLWRYWHNRMHHGHTNQADVDPDLFGTLKRYENHPFQKNVVALAPGSRLLRSGLFFFYWFTFHGQVILWVHSRSRLFRDFDRTRAGAETVIFAVGWAALGWLMGPRGATFGIVLPLALGNAILMSYIATNHFLRPLVDHDDPLDSAMSVRTLRWLDRMHFNFSHHVEHHLFPAMSPKFAPRVRDWLERHEARRYLAPAQWRALVWLYRTPRVHADRATLCDPRDPRRTRVDIAVVERQLA